MDETQNQNPNQNTDNADEELKNIAEKLEKELGHQYFDKPVDLTQEKSENKIPEILELEKEIENLGEIILPGADLKPEDELPAGEKHIEIEKLKNKEIKGEEKRKYKSFRLFREKKESDDNSSTDFWQTLKQEKEEIEKLEIKKLREKEKQEREQRKKLEKEKKEREKEIKRNGKEEREKTEAVEKEKILKEKKLQSEKQLAEWKNIKAERQAAKIEAKNKKRQEKLLKKEQRKKERALRPKFGWYIMVIKRPVIYLCAVEFFSYFCTLIPATKNFFNNIVLSYLIILDLIVFIWLTIRVKKHYEENYGTIVKAVILAGLLTGFFRAVFKVIWIGNAWTIFNIIFEPLIWAGYGLVISAIVGAIVKKQKNNTPLLSFPT